MGMLIDGTWHQKGWETDDDGHFQRSETDFRDWVTTDGSSDFAPDSGRYHLYVSYACPWAHRTLITRALKGLEDDVSVSVVHPFMGDDGWSFEDGDGTIPDRIHGADLLREVYTAADSNYTGRVTVPVLWDRQKDTIVNNESLEIMRMFDLAFDDLASRDIDLYPDDRRDEIDEVIESIYQPINNGVYRAGFSTTQQAYDEAIDELFDALDHWNSVLGERRFLCGDRPTEADICMFTTLFRFDAVYHTHFMCNVRQISDYENLWPYARSIYQLPGVAETCRLDHIKHHYFRSHPSVNPHRIEARGPTLDWGAPQDRT